MRSSFHTAILGDLPVLDAVQAVLDAGYDVVELNAEALPWAAPHVTPDTDAATRRALQHTGRIGSIAAHGPGLPSVDKAERKAAIEWTVALVELASDIGAKNVHVIPGDSPEGSALGFSAGPADLGMFIESLQSLTQRVAHLGVALSLEPIVNQLVSTTDEALYVLSNVEGLGGRQRSAHVQREPTVLMRRRFATRKPATDRPCATARNEGPLSPRWDCGA